MFLAFRNMEVRLHQMQFIYLAAIDYSYTFGGAVTTLIRYKDWKWEQIDNLNEFRINHGAIAHGNTVIRSFQCNILNNTLHTDNVLLQYI